MFKIASLGYAVSATDSESAEDLPRTRIPGDRGTSSGCSGLRPEVESCLFEISQGFRRQGPSLGFFSEEPSGQSCSSLPHISASSWGPLVQYQDAVGDVGPNHCFFEHHADAVSTVALLPQDGEAADFPKDL